jgi:hypothetical protein
MDERRWIPERRQSRLIGRRTTDQSSRPDEYCFETRREVDRLRAVIQLLVDAVQALTASRSKPD